MRFNLFLLFSFILFSGFQCDKVEEPVYAKGELTAISGRVIDTNGELVTSGDIFIHPGEWSSALEEEEILTTPIQSDGTYSVSFFNEEQVRWGATIGRNSDENYACTTGIVAMGEETKFDLIVARHAPEGRLRVIHNSGFSPDSLVHANHINQSRGCSIIPNPPVLIADTLTEYTVFIETDNPNTAIFSIKRDDEFFDERFEYSYEGDTVIFEMRID